MDLCNPMELHALLARHGFHFSKSRGQNFLMDPDILHAIALASGADASCGVLEIGPGAGALTRELAGLAGKVVSVELDTALLPVLSETLALYANVEVLQGDILHMDPAALVQTYFPNLTPLVCANLPYNITSPVLEKLVHCSCFRSITVLVQQEVAQRLAAPPGSGDGSAFSLAVQYHMETELLFDVPPDRFVPRPKVTSSLLRCVRREQPAVEVADEDLFFQVIRGAFFLRRKTLPNSLSAAGFDRSRVTAAMEAVGLPPAVRGEKLTLQQFADLSRCLQKPEQTGEG